MTRRMRTYLIAPLAVAALVATTATGCVASSKAGSKPLAGRTILAPGSGAPVSCTQIPYDSVLDEQDAAGTGVVVSRGYVRGAVWVACVGAPTSFTIKVTLLRNGLSYGAPRTYTAIPNAVGYAASAFDACTPGAYRVQYSYRWAADGGAAADITTTPISETVTQHDCDS